MRRTRPGSVPSGSCTASTGDGGAFPRERPAIAASRLPTETVSGAWLSVSMEAVTHLAGRVPATIDPVPATVPDLSSAAVPSSGAVASPAVPASGTGPGRAADSGAHAAGVTADRLSDAEAHELGLRLQAIAVRRTLLDHEFLRLIDLFDAGSGFASFVGLRSTAHYLGWACGLSPGAARERVRVARALRRMPRTAELFSQGRLSYSKIREITRLVGVVDEDRFCDIALLMTASQLARTVSGYRLAAGSRIRALPSRRYASQPLGDGMVRITLVLPAEEAGIVDAAVEAACRAASSDADPATGPGPDTVEDLLPDTGPQRTDSRPDRVQAVVDIACCYLDQRPATPQDDHTLVIVHVDASSLDLPEPEVRPTSRSQDVPAGTREPDNSPAAAHGLDQAETATGSPGPAALPGLPVAGLCTVEGQGAIEAATAQRLTCNGLVQGVVRQTAGDVLALGRSRRLASRSQRRALRVRDHQTCQFPGCTSSHHLEAHHVRPWSAGGPTDLDNLILICRRHHASVHEGAVRIRPASGPVVSRWEFTLPDGRMVEPDIFPGRSDPDELDDLLAHCADAAARGFPRANGEIDPGIAAPIGGGAGFSLGECVRTLFDITLSTTQEEQQAA